jgi:hypothetical protein
MKVISILKRKYPFIREIKQRNKERRLFFEEAIERFNEDKPLHGDLSDYKKALYKHRVSYREYMYSYEFWRLSESERDEFISQREMWCVYRKTIHTNVRKSLSDKVLFLKTFKDFVHRNWIYPKECSFDAFCGFLESHDCIAKPLLGEQGKGIFLVSENAVSNCQELYNYFKDNDYLLEERIKECRDLEEFHPQSLNTIRVVTMSGKGNFEVLGALLRMGAKDSFVDNTHSGGVFTPIDIQTGETLTDGIDLQGNKYEYHPDSGKRIKGFVIPHWKECIMMCKRASQVIPENYITGWDICVLPDGNIELIEGNSAPDVDGGLQAPLKKGIKKRIKDIGKDVLGYDPISLVSVWSRSYKKYN